ncbi:unnamed protein product, partial [Hapterophycus canaliculatus]
MVMTGDKSYAVKDLLRSMLHAWYELSKGETGAWTTQLEAEIALQQAMENPEQLTKLICEVLFHAWRQHATDPVVREMRNNRPASRLAWVKRMVAPKKRRLRPGVGGDSVKGRSDGPGSNSQQEIDVPQTATTPDAMHDTPSFKETHVALCCKHVRYLRVQTTLPDSIRYGRSPAVPAPPLPEPAPEVSRPATILAATSRRHLRKSNLTDITRCNGSATSESDRTLRFPDGSSIAVDGSFVPDGTRFRNGLFDPHGSSVRKENVVPSGSTPDAPIDPIDRSPNLPSGLPAPATLAGVDGGHIDENVCSCVPPLNWEDLEPWEQRNPRSEWMLSSEEGGVGRRR